MAGKYFEPEDAWTRDLIPPGESIGPALQGAGLWERCTSALAQGMPSVPRDNMLNELEPAKMIRSGSMQILESLDKPDWPSIVEAAQRDRDSGVSVSPSTQPGEHQYCVTPENHLYIVFAQPTTCALDECGVPFEQGAAFERAPDGRAKHPTDAASPWLSDFNTYKAWCGVCGE